MKGKGGWRINAIVELSKARMLGPSSEPEPGGPPRNEKSGG